MVELWRLVLYQLRLSLLLLVSILLICPPKRVIYHCNITALIQTKWCGLGIFISPSQFPLVLSSRNPIPVSGSGCFI